MLKDAKYWIEKLELLPHPEGGYYKEIYRDDEILNQECIDQRFKGDRNTSTAIYYLLEKGDFSCFHRIKSDEIWHHYSGGPINIYYLQDFKLHILKLGLNIEEGESPVCIVPKNTWFAAELASNTKYVLAGCTVAPGFDFQDFEMAGIEQLKNYLKINSKLIQRFIK